MRSASSRPSTFGNLPGCAFKRRCTIECFRRRAAIPSAGRFEPLPNRTRTACLPQSSRTGRRGSALSHAEPPLGRPLGSPDEGVGLDAPPLLTRRNSGAGGSGRMRRKVRVLEVLHDGGASRGHPRGPRARQRRPLLGLLSPIPVNAARHYPGYRHASYATRPRRLLIQTYQVTHQMPVSCIASSDRNQEFKLPRPDEQVACTLHSWDLIW